MPTGAPCCATAAAPETNTASFFLGAHSPANRCRTSQARSCTISDGEDAEEKQVVVGICAMEKKSGSRPMREILTRLDEFEYIRCLIFAETVILKEPVENWPVCDCLISFHSKGFPLEKAIQYAQLRQPFIINDLHMQYILQDRRKVYEMLAAQGISLPRFAVLDRDAPDFVEERDFVESDDVVEVCGVMFNKPFVEKPVSAEDHNIYIYYPSSAGGGSQRLFRKIGSRSSVYSPESRLRRAGSYIYEDFMPTDGTDVKVYTVGLDYAHAEARKSPALDGKVERDHDGKEVRYPVILTNTEKLIARKVGEAFKQTVCGFDLLRANGRSYVCDVNGFSFVKNSNKYYDDSGKILGNMVLRRLAPTLHIPWSIPFQLDDPPIVPTTFGKMMELRCVVAVIRHGDRTPKQKLKMEIRHHKFFAIYHKYDAGRLGHIKLKKPKQLQEVLDVARELLETITPPPPHSPPPSSSVAARVGVVDAGDEGSVMGEVAEKRTKLEQLRNVLEMYGHFSGINRKIQMKYQPRGWRSSSEDESSGEPSLVLVLKWGGELTPAGRVQAEELGKFFRCMYPGGQGEYAGTQGLGLLRLHSTYRHDLKIYASDEGRVQMTAAAFAKGLLALEGELTPILVQMVKSADTNGLLDNDGDSRNLLNIVKSRIHETFQQDREFGVADVQSLNPTQSISVGKALSLIENPVKACEVLYTHMLDLMSTLEEKMVEDKDLILYHGETWELMHTRWLKLQKDFKQHSGLFDISKIPDIYDNIKYDLQHNQTVVQFCQAEQMHRVAKAMADVIVPQEYGLTRQEKVSIGHGICTPLLLKIRADLLRNVDDTTEDNVNRLNPRYSRGVSSPQRHVRTRLYFTSESHIHSLLTMLRYGSLTDESTDEQWCRAMKYVSQVSELNYMSQVVIMLYEDPTKDPLSETRFHVELHFSPGVNCVHTNAPQGPGFRPQSRSNMRSKAGQSAASVPCSSSNLCSCCTSCTCCTGGAASLSAGHQSAACCHISTVPPPHHVTACVIEEEDDETRPATVSTPCSAKPASRDGVLQRDNLQSGACECDDGCLCAKQEDFTSPNHNSRLCSSCCATFVSSSSSTSPPRDINTVDQQQRAASASPTTTTTTTNADSITNNSVRRSSAELSADEMQQFTSRRLLSVAGQQFRHSRCVCLDCPTSPTHAISRSRRDTSECQPIILSSDNAEDVMRQRHSVPSHTSCCVAAVGSGARDSYTHHQATVCGGAAIGGGGAGGGSLFSTAVISGSASAPELKTLFAPTPATIAIEGCGGVPSIRPLETLHNALSLRQVNAFIDRVTSAHH